MTPRAILIAGPNGAGKTSFAREYLPQEGNCLNFINADLIAAGLAPFQQEAVAIRAGEIMLEEIERHVQQRKSFAIETTLSGRTYARMIKSWQTLGYRVELIFLKLNLVELSLARVSVRVSLGGHNIPPDVIRRRFTAGWQNFAQLYQPLVNHCEVYDNSFAEAVNLQRSPSGWVRAPMNAGASGHSLVYQALRRAGQVALDLSRRFQKPCYVEQAESVIDLLARTAQPFIPLNDQMTGTHPVPG